MATHRMPLSQLCQDGVQSDKKFPILHDFVFLVVADRGSFDHSDVVQAKIVPEIRAPTCRRLVSKILSSAVSALSALLSSQIIKAETNDNLNYVSAIQSDEHCRLPGQWGS